MGDIQAVKDGVSSTVHLIITMTLMAACVICAILSYQYGYRHGYAKAADKPTYQATNLDVKNYNGNKISRYGVLIGNLGFGFSWEKAEVKK